MHGTSSIYLCALPRETATVIGEDATAVTGVGRLLDGMPWTILALREELPAAVSKQLVNRQRYFGGTHIPFIEELHIFGENES